MFVEAVNARSNTVGKSQLLGDVGSAFTADFHQFAGILLLRGSYDEEPLHALDKRRARGHVREGVMQALPTDARPVSRLQVALRANFVRIQNVEEA